MLRRSPAPLLAPLLAAAMWTVPAVADDDSQLGGTRIGVVPALGFGFTGFTGQKAYFPSFVATSVSQVELILDTGRWGGFVRAAWLSSGNGGRWNAPLFGLGTTYRFKGDGEERWGVVGRAGVLYQRWSADTGGCSVPWFIPAGCVDLSAPEGAGALPTPTYSTTVDHVGLLAGAMFEIPVEPLFLGLGAELSSTVDVDHANPGLAFAGQLTLSFALRDHLRSSSGPSSPQFRNRTRY